jgi:hypothetical protein
VSGRLSAKVRARVRRADADSQAIEREACSGSVSSRREARVSRNAVAKATRAEDVNMESALRSRATLGVPMAVKTSRSWGLSAQLCLRRG